MDGQVPTLTWELHANLSSWTLLGSGHCDMGMCLPNGTQFFPAQAEDRSVDNLHVRRQW